MVFAAVLKDITLLSIETAPFIYFVERHSKYIDRMRAIFQHVSAGSPQVITSAITLTEVLTLPIEKNETHYQREYREMLLNTEGIRTLPVSISIAERAAHLRAKYRLRTPDSLHISTALIAGCDAFLTNDRALKRVTELQILVLDDL